MSHADAQWTAETLFTWAVCEPTTGELLAEQITTGRPPALTAGLDPLR